MQKPRTIALLTDFGTRDNYAGIMKGVILNIVPDVRIVDITHQINPQNVIQGALSLKSAYRYFPQGTVFVAVVDPGVGGPRKALVIRTRQYTFVVPDNGIAAPTLQQEEVTEIHEITNDRYMLKPVSATFHGRDIFAPVAAHIAKGGPLNRFGRVLKEYTPLNLPVPQTDPAKGQCYGQVLDIDTFGNIITNLEPSHVPADGQIRYKKRTFNGVAASFDQARKGHLIALVGSRGLIELCANQESAAERLQARVGDRLSVSFKSSSSAPASASSSSPSSKRGEKTSKPSAPVEVSTPGPITPMDLYDEMLTDEDESDDEKS